MSKKPIKQHVLESTVYGMSAGLAAGFFLGNSGIEGILQAADNYFQFNSEMYDTVEKAYHIAAEGADDAGLWMKLNFNGAGAAVPLAIAGSVAGAAATPVKMGVELYLERVAEAISSTQMYSQASFRWNSDMFKVNLRVYDAELKREKGPVYWFVPDYRLEVKMRKRAEKALKASERFECKKSGIVKIMEEYLEISALSAGKPVDPAEYVPRMGDFVNKAVKIFSDSKM